MNSVQRKKQEENTEGAQNKRQPVMDRRDPRHRKHSQ